jgi:2'-5' RNA ligase
MPVAIEFFLDEASAGVVRRVWREIAEAGISPFLHTSGVRPHLTLAVGERVDEPAVEAAVRDFAAATTPPAVSFAGVGVAPLDPANVYLTAIVTPDLLDLHARFQRQVAGRIEAPSERYFPGRWVPHCTLVERIPLNAVTRILEICRAIPLPFAARLDEVGVVAFRPVQQRCAFPLTG